MATGNLLLGTGRKSIGDIVLYRRSGKQVSRVRVRKISNPKTEAQYFQRIIMQTVQQAYSRMREITDHSFQGYSGSGNNMSRFLRVNLDALRQSFTQRVVEGEGDIAGVGGFVPLKTKYLAPNPYIISEGSLSPVNFTLDKDGAAEVVAADLPANATYGDVISALGLQRGDQLTFVTISANLSEVVTSTAPYAGADKVLLHYCRVILDPTNADGTAAALTTPFLTGSTINLPSPRNEGTAGFVFGISAGSISVTYGTVQTQAFGVIASRSNGDGTYSYSPCTMAVVPIDSLGQDVSLWGRWDMAYAYQFSLPQTIAASAKYLKQAEKKK